MSNAVSSSKPDPDVLGVLDFWFGDAEDPENVERRVKQWFAGGESQDRVLRERFGPLHDRARRGELDAWVDTPHGALALVLLLDQFTRNLYRGTASAFTNDEQALALAGDGIRREFDRALNVVERAFLYMPFQHSERIEDQRESVELFDSIVSDSPEPLKAFASNTYDYAVQHYELIERFGRFPHRNELLGRRSTPAERAYLDGGGRTFGQG